MIIRLTISPTVVSFFAEFDTVKAFLYIALISALRIRNPTRKDLYKNWPLIRDDPIETTNKPTANRIPCHNGASKVLVKSMRRLKVCICVNLAVWSHSSMKYLNSCGEAKANRSKASFRIPAK